MPKSKLATKSVTKSTTKALRPKTLGVIQPKPLSVAQLVKAQEVAHSRWLTAKQVREAATLAGASEEKLDKLAEQQRALRAAFSEARFARWGAVEAERAVRRGDAPMPETMVLKASAGIVRHLVAYLKAHLAHEVNKAQPDVERVAALRAAFKHAKALLAD